MLSTVLLKPSQSFNWTTDPTVLAWIAIASLIIGVLGILIGLWGGFWFYRKGRNWHRIIYEVISDTPIVSINEKLGKGIIKITYETSEGHVEEINDARLLTLKVWNSGNNDVVIWSSSDKDKANIEEPIEFEFEERTVVGLTHLETNPPNEVIKQENLDKYLYSPSLSSTCLSLPQCILKQNQSIQLGILLNGPSGKIKLKEGKLLNGEIQNIGMLKKRTYNKENLALFMVFFISITIFILLPKSS